MAVTKTYPIRKYLFKLDSWVLSQYQYDTASKVILGIVHSCPKQPIRPGSYFWWGKYVCSACGERIPDELQALYILYKAGQ